MTTDEKDDVAAAALYLDIIKRRSFSPFKSFDEWAATWIANNNLQVAEGLLHCVLSLPNRNDIRPVRLLITIVVKNGPIGDEKFPLQLRAKALTVLANKFLKEDDVRQGQPLGQEAIKSHPEIVLDIMTLLRDCCGDPIRIPDSRLKILRWFLTCCNQWLRAYDLTAMRRILEQHRALFFTTLIRYGLGELIRKTLDRDIGDPQCWFEETQQDMKALRLIVSQHTHSIDEAILGGSHSMVERECREAAFLHVALESVYRARRSGFSSS